MNSLTIKVTSIRYQGTTGGGVFGGQLVDEAESRVVVLNRSQLPDSSLLAKGQLWDVTGRVESKVREARDGVQITEATITAETAHLRRPALNNLIDFIAGNPKIRGVGDVKARKLVDAFGDALPSIIEERRTKELQRVISEDAAFGLCDAFAEVSLLAGLQALDGCGLSPSVGRKVIHYFGTKTHEVIHDNPYLLISFMGSWKGVDDLATSRCGIHPDDPKRLSGALEDALYSCFDNGSTVVAEPDLKRHLVKRLGAAKLAMKALALPATSGQFYRTAAGFHPAGPWLMEKTVARFINQPAPEVTQSELELHAPKDIDAIIDKYEADAGFSLTSEQRDAVTTCATSRVSALCGGAGVGKTTVLRCLIDVIEGTDERANIIQMALAGKAALRMSESTRRPAFTIAGFLNSADFESAADNTRHWLLIDEASMLDIITLYRVIRLIPEDTRIVLIGDPYQLPPVGPGLTLHALMEGPVPTSSLTIVQRQAESTGIPSIAGAVRSGSWPDITTISADGASPISDGVFFLPCDPGDINEHVVKVFGNLSQGALTHDVKVLSPTKTGNGGCLPINTAIQEIHTNGRESVDYVDSEFGLLPFIQSSARHRFHIGDLVIFTRNDYARGLRNGSLGKIISKRRLNPSEDTDESPVCVVEFEGGAVELTAADLDSLELSYSITVHKSQGSQFERVIIPIRGSRLLDRSLLYTGITRAVRQVIFIGDAGAAAAGVRTTNASQRRVGLPYHLGNQR